MAHLTNKLGLPEPIVAAVRRDDYDPGASDITVTQLIAPPKVVELSRRHDDEIEEDASERLFALDGKVVHSILEKGTGGRGDEAVMVEERLYTDVLGWKVGGQFDRMVLIPYGDGWLLQDYKRTSVWEWVYGLKEAREQQLNLLAYLAEQNGYPIRKLEAVLIFRDWMKPKAMRETNYPQRQVEIVPVELWEPEVAEAFMTQRVIEHQGARALDDQDIPVCTPEERWQKPTQWAVRKEGRKSAVAHGLHESEADAQAFIEENWADDPSLPDKERKKRAREKEKLWVEERPGEPTRCMYYCPAAKFCEFGRWFHEEEDD